MGDAKFGVHAAAAAAVGAAHQCGAPVTHVPQLAAAAWAVCELPRGHQGPHQITLRWEGQ